MASGEKIGISKGHFGGKDIFAQKYLITWHGKVGQKYPFGALKLHSYLKDPCSSTHERSPYTDNY